MKLNILVGSVIAIAGFLAHRADAAMIVAAPVIVPFDEAAITVAFQSSEAAHTGKLYFLGSGDLNVITTPSAHSDETELGQFLFANHDPAANSVALAGTFHAGDVLYFAYDVIAPDYAIPDLFRWDLVADRNQFGWDEPLRDQAGTLSIEDLHPSNGGYDGDFNDLIVTIQFTQTPTPGSLALLAIGTLFGLRQRRRRAY